MIDIRSRVKGVADKPIWSARGAAFMAKLKATKAVWFPPEPAATGKKTAKKASATARKTTKRATKKTAGGAKKTTAAAKRSSGAKKVSTPVGRKKASQ